MRKVTFTTALLLGISWLGKGQAIADFTNHNVWALAMLLEETPAASGFSGELINGLSPLEHKLLNLDTINLSRAHFSERLIGDIHLVLVNKPGEEFIPFYVVAKSEGHWVLSTKLKPLMPSCQGTLFFYSHEAGFTKIGKLKDLEESVAAYEEENQIHFDIPKDWCR